MIVDAHNTAHLQRSRIAGLGGDAGKNRKPERAIALARKQRVSGDQIQLAIVIEVGYSRKAARLLL